MPDSVQEKIQALREAARSVEKQRAILGDVVVDTAIQALEKQIAELQPDQQRKQATILMLDIADHTRMIRDLDPEENLEIVDTAIVSFQKPITEFGGRVTRVTGDGFKAIFGHPEAFDNDPEMAVRAGLGILQAAEQYSREIEVKWGIKNFKVRIGIDTGIVVIGGLSEALDTVKGEAVNLANRLEQFAPPGGMLISGQTEKLVHGLFELREHPPLELKGFDEPVQAFEVLALKEQSFIDKTRGVEWVITPLVGRSEQLARLDETLEQVRTQRKARVATVIAEAGVGKSRLMSEFEHRLPEDIRVFKARSQREYERTPYAVFRNLFSRHLGIQENVPTEQLFLKFDQFIAPVLGKDEEGRVRAHFIGNLLGFDFSQSQYLEGVLDDAQQFSDRAWSYLIDYFRNISEEKICVLLIEDIHWADSQSLDVINQLAYVADRQALFIVCNSRPSIYERREQWGKAHHAFINMRLPPLSRRDSRQLIGEILTRAENIPLILREFIVSGAEGNPFYIEELIKMLIENNVINKTETGWQIEQNRLLELEVPPTLTGIVQARLDSLEPLEKSLLQQAAVVGRNFWDGVLFHINSSESGSKEHNDILNALAALNKKEMIYPRRHGAFSGFREYAFKHAILREVTYETVLKRLRPVYHGLVAEWLIDYGTDTTSEFTPMIAGHLEQAGQLERAAVYLRMAGEQSMKQYANDEAIRFLSQALELLPDNELEERFRVILARTQIYSLQGMRDAQRIDIFALADLARELDDDQRRGEVALLQAIFASEHSDYNKIIRFSQQVIEWGQSSGDARLQGHAHQLWGRALIAKGQYPEAKGHLEQAISIAKEASLSQIEADSLRYMGIVAERLETTEAAVEKYEESLSIYRRIGDLRGEGWLLNDLGNLMLRRQDLYDQAWSHINRFHEITEKIGDLQGKGSSFHLMAEASRRRGDFEKASDYLIMAMEISERTGNETLEIGSLFELGMIAIEKSEFAEAGKYFTKVISLARALGNKPMEAKAILEIGRLFHRQGDFVRTMRYYRHAHSMFSELGNRRSAPRALAFIGLLNYQLNKNEEAIETLQSALSQLEPYDSALDKAFVLTQLGRAKLGLGSHSEALRAFEQAHELFTSLEEDIKALEPHAGMAEIHMLNGETSFSLSFAENIIDRVDRAEKQLLSRGEELPNYFLGLDGTTDPVYVYFTCCQVLQAANDQRAPSLLEKIVRMLHAQSKRIEEIDQQQSFLNIPLHQKILQSYQQVNRIASMEQPPS